MDKQRLDILDTEIEKYRGYKAIALAEYKAGSHRMLPYLEGYASHLDRLVSERFNLAKRKATEDH